MNEEKFKIWREWKEKQREIDLRELDENFAQRGLAQSGLREQSRLNLNERYDAEIAMEESSMKEEESERKARNRERRNLISTNRILAAMAILSFVATIYFSNLTTEIQLRPQFEVKSERYFSNTASSSEELIIENRDGTCTGFETEIITLAEVFITENSINKTYLIPLDGYFDWRYMDNCAARFSSRDYNTGYNFTYYNAAALNDLSIRFNLFMYEKNILANILFPSHFVKIKYQDRLGKERIEYQQISNQFRRKISQDRWEYVSKLHDQRKHFNLQTGPEEMFSLINSLEPDLQKSNQP